jgi:hypothetical protein
MFSASQNPLAALNPRRAPVRPPGLRNIFRVLIGFKLVKWQPRAALLRRHAIVLRDALSHDTVHVVLDMMHEGTTEMA